MKLISRIILSTLLVLVPMCTLAQERYVKGMAQADMLINGGIGFNIGAGVHLGKKEQRVNFQTSINYSSISSISDADSDEITGYSEETEAGIKYARISVPVEMHIKFLDTFFAGGGVVYNYNMNGKIFDVNDEENTMTALTDAVNAHNFAGRICGGVIVGFSENMIFGFKIYTDINITPPLKRYSVNDRLFEYTGPIEDSLGNATFGMAVYCTF